MHAPPSKTLLILAAIALGACPASPEPGDTLDASPGPAPVPSGRHAPPPALGELRLGDMTPDDLRPPGIPELGPVLVREAFFGAGAFARAPEGAPTACRGQVMLGYGLIANGQPVKGGEAGEARAVIEAEVHCPLTDPERASEDRVDTFRVTIAEARAWGAISGGTSSERLEEAVGAAARQAAEALNGQIRMRHASDADILEALHADTHGGVLAESASEAGERRLTAALPDLVRLTTHPDGLVAVRAGAALGLLGDGREEVVRALAKMTDGPSEERHLVAIHALGDLGTDEALRYLDTLAVGHPDAPLREAARRAIKEARERRSRTEPPGD